MKLADRSPLKGKPLRNPGQSLDEQRNELAVDNVLVPSIVALIALYVAGLEWWRVFHPGPMYTYLYTVLAVFALIYASWKVWRTLPILRRLRLASEGEKVVGQFLESLREHGYRIFHDVVGDNFNLDHVIVGPAGVFTVETKTRSKPVRGDSKVTFDGEKIFVGGFESDRDAVVQAKAQASWLRTLLAESTGRTFNVRSVIVFPGWFVEQTGRSTSDLWVLEPKALPKFLEKTKAILATEDIALASFHVSRYVRAKEKSAA